MEFAMSMTVRASPAELWETLIDVGRISACIPGCERVEEIERLVRYTALFKQKVGPFKIEAPAEIRVESVAEPSRVRTRATGRDRFTGTRLAVVMEVTVTPRDDTGSDFAVAARVDVQGRLASLGFGVVKRRVDQNFAEFEARLKKLLEAA